MNVGYYSDRSRTVLYPAAALSLLAALIHFWVIPEHFEEWWGYGAFFVVAATAQSLYAVALLRWPSQKLLLLGIVGNSLIILMYLLTRVIGIPFFGPEAGKVEAVGIIDVCATASEAVLIIVLGTLLLSRLIHERIGTVLIFLAGAALLLAHLPHLLLLFRLL
jgi:hypothetical protein